MTFHGLLDEVLTHTHCRPANRKNIYSETSFSYSWSEVLVLSLGSLLLTPLQRGRFQLELRGALRHAGTIGSGRVLPDDLRAFGIWDGERSRGGGELKKEIKRVQMPS